jgi:hypothetical protein
MELQWKKVEKRWYSTCGKYELYRHTFRDKKSVIECYSVSDQSSNTFIGFTVDSFKEAVKICTKHLRRNI